MDITQSVRGTHDLLPNSYKRHQFIIDQARKISSQYGFSPIATPIIEYSSVFKRTLGEDSDVISKEMYCFNDLGGKELVLRPEGTAAVVRAIINHQLYLHLPIKLFYHGPMFRYDRPQKGRQRQFHQIGIEFLGENSYLADVESIALAYDFLHSLELRGEITLHLNTLGDQQSRAKYRAVLKEYLHDRRTELSEISQARLQNNPLRILDSKDKGDQNIIIQAPVIADCLTSEAQGFFDKVREKLDYLGYRYVLNPLLVRGLDYYDHTIFEFTTEALGAQSTILGGGRYDGLVAMMGGPSLSGVGWAAGIERLDLLLDPDKSNSADLLTAYVMPITSQEVDYALKIAQKLRSSLSLSTHVVSEGQISKRLSKANKNNVRFAIIVGEEELKHKTVAIKDLLNDRQFSAKYEEICAVINAEK